MNKIIVAGGRDFYDRDLLAETMRMTMDMLYDDTVEIVCGGASGADQLGAEWAHENHLGIKYFDADWATHGRAAGPIRNQAMAEYADALVAFWDGCSRGTRDMIGRAIKSGLWVKVVRYESSPD